MTCSSVMQCDKKDNTTWHNRTRQDSAAPRHMMDSTRQCSTLDESVQQNTHFNEKQETISALFSKIICISFFFHQLYYFFVAFSIRHSDDQLKQVGTAVIKECKLNQKQAVGVYFVWWIFVVVVVVRTT